ncbi:sensor histidine kinase [Hartmannibacter diazotrophicus]|nr:sensor histidine kinase [Hartmannibacter diazotrophicus]
MLALIASGASVMLQDESLDFIFISNLPDAWTIAAGDQPSDPSIFGEDIASRLKALKLTVRDGQEQTASMEAETRGGRIFEFRVQALSTPTAGTQTVTTIRELTEDRRKERALADLLLEVSHRSKNLLAVVHSIAAQTARNEVGVDNFLRKFRGRLYSLSHSQDLVTERSWQGAMFSDLVNTQVMQYLPTSLEVASLSGDDVLLNPVAALHVGLALHELTMNAIDHGNVREGMRRISLSSQLVKTNGQSHLQIEWIEMPVEDIADNPPASAMEASRFGSVVLSKVVPASVNGTARYEVNALGVRYFLDIPV